MPQRDTACACVTVLVHMLYLDSTDLALNPLKEAADILSCVHKVRTAMATVAEPTVGSPRSSRSSAREFEELMEKDIHIGDIVEVGHFARSPCSALTKTGLG